MNDLKSILDRILKSTPNYEENMLKGKVHELWPRIVGERAAKHCWPVKFIEKDVLLVAAESSAWLQSLRYLETQILEKFEAELKHRKVRGLRFMLATHFKSSTSKPKGTLG